MLVEKLQKKEHELTRALYEECFPEDSGRFVDYYYSYKATDNEIYVIRDGKKIVSMVHLNPYRMQVGSHVETLHYIVAVGTAKAYRGRGFMDKLMSYVLDVMYDRGESFTFLMPVSEGLYEKYDFVTVYRQSYYKVEHPVIWQRGLEEAGYSFRKAIEPDCADLAKKASALLSRRYDIYAIRNAYYYETLLEEQKAQRGGIMMIEHDDKLIGMYLYDREEGFEIREPLIEKKYERTVFGALQRCHQTNMMVRVLCRENLSVPMKNLFLNEIV